LQVIELYPEYWFSSWTVFRC